MQKRIFLLGEIVPGQTEIQWRISPLPVEKPPADGELQASIDYGAELQELLDAREDEAFWARGQW